MVTYLFFFLHRSALKICQRSIELHRDKQLTLASSSSLSSSSTVAATAAAAVPTYVNYMTVNQATLEYRNNPMLLAVTEGTCLLERIILLAMCQHHRATGGATVEVCVEEGWQRTGDILTACRGYLKEQQFPSPLPYFWFKENIEQLLLSGIITRTDLGGRTNTAAPFSIGGGGVDRYIVAPQLLHADIISALRQSNDPIVKILFASEM